MSTIWGIIITVMLGGLLLYIISEWGLPKDSVYEVPQPRTTPMRSITVHLTTCADDTHNRGIEFMCPVGHTLDSVIEDGVLIILIKKKEKEVRSCAYAAGAWASVDVLDSSHQAAPL